MGDVAGIQSLQVDNVGISWIHPATVTPTLDQEAGPLAPTSPREQRPRLQPERRLISQVLYGAGHVARRALAVPIFLYFFLEGIREWGSRGVACHQPRGREGRCPTARMTAVANSDRSALCDVSLAAVGQLGKDERKSACAVARLSAASPVEFRFRRWGGLAGWWAWGSRGTGSLANPRGHTRTRYCLAPGRRHRNRSQQSRFPPARGGRTAKHNVIAFMAVGSRS